MSDTVHYSNYVHVHISVNSTITPIDEKKIKLRGKSTWRKTAPIANSVSNLRRTIVRITSSPRTPHGATETRPGGGGSRVIKGQRKPVERYRVPTEPPDWLIGYARLGTTAHTRTDTRIYNVRRLNRAYVCVHWNRLRTFVRYSMSELSVNSEAVVRIIFGTPFINSDQYWSE